MLRWIKTKIEAFQDINCLGGLFWFILCLEQDSILCLQFNFFVVLVVCLKKFSFCFTSTHKFSFIAESVILLLAIYN